MEKKTLAGHHMMCVNVMQESADPFNIGLATMHITA